MITTFSDGTQVFDMPCGKCGRGMLTHRHCSTCEKIIEAAADDPFIIVTPDTGPSPWFCGDKCFKEWFYVVYDSHGSADKALIPDTCSECGCHVDEDDPASRVLVRTSEAKTFCSSHCLRDHAVREVPKVV